MQQNILKNPLTTPQPQPNPERSMPYKFLLWNFNNFWNILPRNMLVSLNEPKALIKQPHLDAGMHNLPSELQIP